MNQNYYMGIDPAGKDKDCTVIWKQQDGSMTWIAKSFQETGRFVNNKPRKPLTRKQRLRHRELSRRRHLVCWLTEGTIDQHMAALLQDKMRKMEAMLPLKPVNRYFVPESD